MKQVFNRFIRNGIVKNGIVFNQPKYASLVPSYTNIRFASNVSGEDKIKRNYKNPKLEMARPTPDTSNLKNINELSELVNSLDLSLTPEQREYVEKIKKSYKGRERSLYRDVPREDEIEAEGNFISNVPENAEKIIDYALSFIPPRAGPRRSRHKKRMEHRNEQRRQTHARRIAETRLAKQVKLGKKKKEREEVKQIRMQAQQQLRGV